MKVCFMLGGFHQNGGIGRVTSMLVNKLAEYEDVEIVTLSYADWELPNLYEISKKVQQECFLDNYKNMLRVILTGGRKKLRKFLKDNKIDIVVACGALFYPICVNACKGIKTKCICWEHSNPEGNNDHRGQNLVRKYGIKRADMNVVLTKSAQEIYTQKYNVTNTVQIYNPVDEKIFSYSRHYDDSIKKIVSVGRLSYQKYFEKAIEVAKRILPKHPDWEWDIYGKGEEFETLNEMIINSGLSEQMHLRGQVNNLYERYRDYSIMVMTSRYEGFPMTLLEGSGNGLPLISFDVPTGPNEIIEDGVNGFLISAFDEEKMSEKIIMVMEDDVLRKKISLNSKELCLRFREEEIVNQWRELLGEVI